MDISVTGTIYDFQAAESWKKVDEIIAEERTYYLGPYMVGQEVKLIPGTDGVSFKFEKGSDVTVAEDRERRRLIFAAQDMGQIDVGIILPGQRK